MSELITGDEAIQGSDAWLGLRAKYRTASEASAVMGVSPFQSIDDFKLIKAGLKTVFYSKAMQQGNELEDEVRQKAEALLDDVFEPQVYINGNYLASLDGINIDGDTLVELKVSEHTYNELQKGIIPKHYQIQVLQQMYCSGAVNGYLIAMNPKTKEIACSKRIEFEDKFIDALDNAWIEFEDMPIPEVKESVDMGEVGAWISATDELKALQKTIATLKEREAELKDTLISLGGGKKAYGNGVKLIFKKGATRTDYRSALAKFAPNEDLEEFKTTSVPTWAISVDKE